MKNTNRLWLVIGALLILGLMSQQALARRKYTGKQEEKSIRLGPIDFGYAEFFALEELESVGHESDVMAYSRVLQPSYVQICELDQPVAQAFGYNENVRIQAVEVESVPVVQPMHTLEPVIEEPMQVVAAVDSKVSEPMMAAPKKAKKMKKKEKAVEQEMIAMQPVDRHDQMVDHVQREFDMLLNRFSKSRDFNERSMKELETLFRFELTIARHLLKRGDREVFLVTFTEKDKLLADTIFSIRLLHGKAMDLAHLSSPDANKKNHRAYLEGMITSLGESYDKVIDLYQLM